MALEAVCLDRIAAVVVHRQRDEVVLQVRPGELLAAADEAAGLEVVRRGDPGPFQVPLDADGRLVVPQQRRVERDRLQAFVLQVHLEVVLQVLADAGAVDHDRNAQRAQRVGRPHARAQQQLRRGDRAAADQHLAARARLPHLVALQPGHADGAVALKQHPVAQGAGAHRQVRALARRVEVGQRGAAAPPVGGGGAVHRAEAFLTVAVQVVGAGVAGLLARAHEGLEQRADVGLRRGDVQRALAAVPVVGALVAGLGLAEIGQAVGVAPALQAGLLRPALVVHRVAADVDHAVDQRRAAQALAAALRHAPPAHVRLGLGDVGPVVGGALQRVGQRGGHLRAPVEPPVGAAGLQQQHRHVGILGQPRGQHAAGRASADDDVVELVGQGVLLDLRHGEPSFRRRTSPRRPARG